jgi:hypothetical protein
LTITVTGTIWNTASITTTTILIQTVADLCVGNSELYDCDCNCLGESDCADECGGSAVLSGCDNVCNSTAVEDCAGTCGGSAVLSGCDNVCNSTAIVDCADECGGSAELDDCGECGGSGVADACDCTDTSGLNDDGCCDDVVADECGECGGDGSSCTPEEEPTWTELTTVGGDNHLLHYHNNHNH